MKPIISITGLALCSLNGLAQQQPNFLIIQCDHLTQRVVGAYGEMEGVTPAIDRVASQGVVFANAYVGCPLSQPSRAALWTGLMPHQTNVRSNTGERVNNPVSEHISTLGSLFSAAGYETVHFGKTHDMGALRGFEHKEPMPQPFEDPEFPVNRDSFLDVGTCQDVVGYLNNPPETPFICIVDFQNPHNICGYVGANAGIHIDKPISGDLPQLPANFEVENWNEIPIPIQYICCNHRRMAQASEWSEMNYRHYIAAFRHYTRMVDKQIAQVLEALYAMPSGQHTIVVIMSDHGDGMGSHRMVTKQVSFYEEVTNVPFIFAGTGIRKIKNPVDKFLTQPTLDLLPTLCELAGIESPKDKPGISIAPFLKGRKQKDTHPYVVSEWHTEYEEIITPGRMIRSSRYKYTHYLEGEGEELYDLKKDPGEKVNLAYNPAYTKVLEEHRRMLDDYIRRTNDDYRSLEIKADKCWREHASGYPSHRGSGSAWDTVKER